MSALARVGVWVEGVGDVALLGVATLRDAARARIRGSELIHQIDVIGSGSVMVASLTAIFSSMVLVVQFAVQMARFGATDYVGSVVALSLVRELGPVLTALLVGGRVGSGIAAELGAMKVGEQIDAIRSMGADPVNELVVPRVLASLVVMPLLTAFAEGLGFLGAMVIARLSLGINMIYFFFAAMRSMTWRDASSGLIKTLVFGLIISLVACQQGMATHGGTEGVGRATTHTVVIASIAILISDFVMTSVLLAFGF